MAAETRIRPLAAADCEPLSAAFARQGWDKPASQFRRYLAEAAQDQRTILVAEHEGALAGYVTIRWESGYPPFRARRIPEIVDLNVLQLFQRRGIGTALLETAEGLIARRSPIAGIGVGLTADYGPAQRLYIRHGYAPDGHGLHQDGQPVAPGARVEVNDDLNLFLTRAVTAPGTASPGADSAPADPEFQGKLRSLQEMLENL